jgi:hypothetical protein
MEFRTKIDIEPSKLKITYSDKVMFLGSCFASNIGSKMAEGRMPVMINPAGTVYNPFSVINTIEAITSGKLVTRDDLYFHNSTWLSFSHYTDFSSDDPDHLINKINRNSKEAGMFLSSARVLFITFGTAWVYKLNETGRIVSNCHKVPSSYFRREMISVDEIVRLWNEQLDYLHATFPGLQVVFTISPVRHWKDGAHGNQVSKSVLFLAVEELLSHPSAPQYFPAYEIQMDELRDYRYYSDDMLHPSSLAINYIWESFSSCYMDEKTIRIWREASNIVKGAQHRINVTGNSRTKEFAENMLRKISSIKAEVPEIDLSSEEVYFNSLGSGGKVG